jgi:hypothetical protein
MSNRTIINFWLDVFLLVVFMLLCWSSVIVRYVFPVGPEAEGWTLWGLDYLAWADIQFATLCLLLISVLLHVMLHWTWVCGIVENWQRRRHTTTGGGAKPNTGNRTLWGVGLLIVLLNILGLGIAAASLTVQAPAIY